MAEFKHGTYGSFAETIYTNKIKSKRPVTPSPKPPSQGTDTYVFTWDELKVAGAVITFCLVEGLTKELLDGGFTFTLEGINPSTGEAYTLTGTVPANNLTWEETSPVDNFSWEGTGDIMIGTPTTNAIDHFVAIITLKANVKVLEHDSIEITFPKAGVYIPAYADGLLGLLLGTERLSIQFLNGTIQTAN